MKCSSMYSPVVVFAVSKGLIISSILSCDNGTTVVDPVDIGVRNISAMRTRMSLRSSCRVRLSRTSIICKTTSEGTAVDMGDCKVCGF